MIVNNQTKCILKMHFLEHVKENIVRLVCIACLALSCTVTD